MVLGCWFVSFYDCGFRVVLCIVFICFLLLPFPVLLLLHFKVWLFFLCFAFAWLFLRRLYLFYCLFCVIFHLSFGFFANFPTLFLAELGLFHSLGLLCCSVWLGEVKVILLQQRCCLFMHACVSLLIFVVRRLKVDSCSVIVECASF